MSAVEMVAEKVADHMERMERLFKPGVKITVLVRTPDHPDRDFLMTSDTIPEIMEALQRRAAEGPDDTPPGPPDPPDVRLANSRVG